MLIDLLIIIAVAVGLLFGRWVIFGPVRRSRALQKERERDANIRKMEEELGLPTTTPRKWVADINPTNLQLVVNRTVMIPGDMITVRCTWPGCRYEVTTEVSETTVLSHNNIPGGDQLIRHQADYAHWTSNITTREWAR
jgi:hypothetical protein